MKIILKSNSNNMMRREISHFIVLLGRLAIVLMFFEVTRLLFLLFNWDYFHVFSSRELFLTFWYGLLFDTSAILYLNVIFIFTSLFPFKFREKRITKNILKYLFFITNGAAILLNVVDIVYFKFSNKRSGIELFEMRKDVGDMFFRYVLDYWYMLAIIILLIALLIYLYNKTRLKNLPVYNLKSYLIQSLLLILSAGLFILGGRGGTNLKPIRPFDATRFLKPALMPVVLNTPFTIMFTSQNYGVLEADFIPVKEAEKLYHPFHYPKPASSIKKKNVVIIILESIGKECVGFYNKDQGYTPFLDSLCKEGLVYMDAYSNGKTSNRGVPAVLASIPSWLEVPYLNSNYQANRLNSIGQLLSKKGYYTAFFHAARNGSMAFDNFISVSEFGEYFGMNEYPYKTDFDGEWGIYDEPFLQFALSTINKKPEPFCISVFTLSSHHPYVLPEKYKNKFDATHPLHKMIKYTDYSVKQFFDKASKTKWFNHTVFILTSDHSAENQKEFYQTLPGRYAIPIVFYTPDGSLKGEVNGTVSQIDIMPALMGYLNYDLPYFSFGNDIIQPDFESDAVQYDNGLWQYIKTPYVLHFDGKRVVGFYEYPKDSFLLSNLTAKNLPVIPVLENKLKAIIQTYNNCLINNKTYLGDYK